MSSPSLPDQDRYVTALIWLFNHTEPSKKSQQK